MAFLLSQKFWLDLLFPVCCLACRREAGSYLCSACRPLLKFDSPEFSLTLKNIEAVFVAGNYDNPLLADLIKKFKFNSITEIGKILSDFLILFWQGQASLLKRPETLNNSNRLNAPLVIPIPLSQKRRRMRGFNQAELIAREFALAFNYELSLDLKKIKNTKAQARLNEKARQKNLTKAFSWTGKNLAGREIILIDDVITTGVTIDTAAAELKQAGAHKVIALGLAKG